MYTLSRTLLFCVAVFYFLHVRCCHSSFSDSFRRFIVAKYGYTAERELARDDLLPTGSFGGGMHIAGEQTRLRPVIFVHGLDTNAATFLPNRDYFLQNGYLDEELYATSYRPALLPLLTDKMTCHHVRQIRLLIRTVHEFTNSPVDVIGYSMGSPISRKAIMGGVCVDTGEQLGSNITNLVQTFIGVVGANFGAQFLCALPIESCNIVNGIVCNSLFLKDINSRSGYEASTIYTIYTTSDEVVGVKSCNGQRITSIPGEHQSFRVKAFLQWSRLAAVI